MLQLNLLSSMILHSDRCLLTAEILICLNGLLVCESHFHGSIVGGLAKGITIAGIMNSLNMWNGVHTLHDCTNTILTNLVVLAW